MDIYDLRWPGAGGFQSLRLLALTVGALAPFLLGEPLGEPPPRPPTGRSTSTCPILQNHVITVDHPDISSRMSFELKTCCCCC